MFKRVKNSVVLALLVPVLMLFTVSCGSSAKLRVEQGMGPNPELPAPVSGVIPTVNVAKAVGWPDGVTPIAATGFKVTRFAAGLDHPRWLYVLPNGDVLVAESNAQAKETHGIKAWAAKRMMTKAGAAVASADRITLLRDTTGDGVADFKSAFATELTSPIGMVLVGNDFYVANTDAIVRFAYTDGQTKLPGIGEQIAPLPAGSINHHWTKGLIASPDGTTLFVSVGSNSNIAENGMENEVRRAAILAVDRMSGETRVYASGLRNPVGMDWNPVTGELWTVVNERDEIGGDLVPDYMTSVKEGGFYGWPYSYYGTHIDTRVQPQNAQRVASALSPDYALGPHTASLGLVFYTANHFPGKYKNGVFVGQHGSWNRKPRSGYKVIFVAFEQGKPVGLPTDILTGFVDNKGQAQGRPVGVVVNNNGALLVADDVGNVIWMVSKAMTH